MTYEQARKDHEYLWSTYAAAGDMTGGYVDQDDLERLLRSPTKATARQCYENQIAYWFSFGPEPEESFSADVWKKDPVVREIAERHNCENDFERLCQEGRP